MAATPQWRPGGWLLLSSARAAGRPGPDRARAAWGCAGRATIGTCGRSRGPVAPPGSRGGEADGHQWPSCASCHGHGPGTAPGWAARSHMRGTTP
eukprot:6497929-Lingulodinium_polyedra.AAC.1